MEIAFSHSAISVETGQQLSDFHIKHRTIALDVPRACIDGRWINFGPCPLPLSTFFHVLLLVNSCIEWFYSKAVVFFWNSQTLIKMNDFMRMRTRWIDCDQTHIRHWPSAVLLFNTFIPGFITPFNNMSAILCVCTHFSGSFFASIYSVVTFCRRICHPILIRSLRILFPLCCSVYTSISYNWIPCPFLQFRLYVSLFFLICPKILLKFYIFFPLFLSPTNN